MKKLLTLCLLTASIAVRAQTKPDSTKIAVTQLQTLSRNALLIQQTIHRMDMSALLRDKLDSVYSQSMVIIEDRLKGKNP